MKAKVFNKNFVVLFLLIIILGSCKYDFVVPEPEPVKPDPVVEVNAYALPESISYAGTTTLYWTSKNVTSVTLNDIPVSVNGPKTLEALTVDTVFTLKFTGYNGQVITKSVSIAVAEPIIVLPTRTDTICGRYWMLTGGKTFIDSVWNERKFDEDKLSRKWYFYKNGVWKLFNKDGVLIGEATCRITQDSVIIANDKAKIVSLTDTSLVLSATYLNFEKYITTVTEFRGYKITSPQ